MKDTASKGSASLLITVAVVLIHLVVIGAIIWGCSSNKEKAEPGKDSAAPEAAVASGAPEQGSGAETPAPPAPVKTRYRVPSANPNFGKPLDFSGADTSDMQKRLVPEMKEWLGTGIIVDMDTHKVLWEKESRKPVPVASMVKMMTALLVAEEMERNPELTLDTKITVTKSAMQAIPNRESDASRIGLEVGQEITMRDLLLCLLLHSANDAANQLAEVVCGDVDKFIGRMNRRAREFGMNSMKFYTTNGLNNWEGEKRLVSVASAADMVRLAERLLEYPFLLEMTSKRSAEVTLNGQKRVITSTNILINTWIKGLKGVKPVPGVDGLKTGYLKIAGACLTFSVLRNGRRMVGCVTCFPLHRNRHTFCSRLIDWAYDPQSINKPRPASRNSAPGKKSGGKKSSGKKSNKKSRSK